MKLARCWAVFRSECTEQLRRAPFWVLLGLVVLVELGLSREIVVIRGAGSWEKPMWRTSEFFQAEAVAFLVLWIESFFVVVAAAMAALRDEGLGTRDLLRVTGLTPTEEVLGKLAALGVLTLDLLVVQVSAAAFFHQVWPDDDRWRGPFALGSYVRPMLVLGLPPLVFLGGIAFAIAAWSRRLVLAFLLPVPFLLLASWLAEWVPTWVDPALQRALMLLEPSGNRWLAQTWFDPDRGAEFYNQASLHYDLALLASRLALVVIGAGAALACIPLTARQWRGRSMRSPVAKPEGPALVLSAAPATAMIRRRGAVESTLVVARFELGEILQQPSLLVFAPAILLLLLPQQLWPSDGFLDTPLLVTPGRFAVSAMSSLTLFLLPILLFLTVESLHRERAAGLAPILHATPVADLALVLGKLLANLLVALAVFGLAFVAAAITILVQGQVALAVGPFAIVWGLLLLPTLVLWLAFAAFLYALTRSRYAAHGLGLVAAIATFLFGRQSWITNWTLAGAVRWSDLGVLELDRPALVLSRLAALGLAALLFALAVWLFPRGERRGARRQVVRTRLSDLGVLSIVPVTANVILAVMVARSFPKQARSYDEWVGWSEGHVPLLVAVDMDLELEPKDHWFHTKGELVLRNPGARPIAKIPVRMGDHTRNERWTIDGVSVVPREDLHFGARFVTFGLDPPLMPGATVALGFDEEGRLPDGITRHGGGMAEFILPSGVVLTSLTPTFTPLIPREWHGYSSTELDERERRTHGLNEGLTASRFGAVMPFDVRIRIEGPPDFTFNSVGSIESDAIEHGRRVTVWRSEQPVSFFNVVAGRWAVRRGEGVAVFYHPEHAHHVDEMVRVLAAARRHYSQWFGPYPWAELKLSEFPGLADYAQGMPTNIPFSESMGFLARDHALTRVPFLIAAHEAAHQWWGDLVVPGENGELISEGLAHYSVILLAEELYGLAGRMAICQRFEEDYVHHRMVDWEVPLVKEPVAFPGGFAAVYDKGGWFFWMMQQAVGRDAMHRALHEFLVAYRANPDHPTVEDLAAILRRLAPVPEAFDDFLEQWLYALHLGEYRITSASKGRRDDTWEVTATVTNVGTGCMPVEVAATRGARFEEQTEDEARSTPAGVRPDYREARASVVLPPGEERTVTIRCGFDPDRVIVDPDVLVLQLHRERAAMDLR